ncbi:CotH kinase family protein [Rhodococcus zopfii]|uniref:CotH kinase family protein n=1 Tax=Rhodococcus zopfii TaxID=43772 RepID=UPI0035284AC9
MSGTTTGGEPRPRRPLKRRRRLNHRIPTSLRQHWTLLVVFVAFVTTVGTVFGSARIRPYITGDATIIASEITDNISGTVDLFDSSVQHDVSLEISDAEYEDMITSFQKTGEKKWILADLTIDGTFVNDVSVRLKGNSTLMGVRGDDAVPGGSGFQPPEGLEPPEGSELPEDFVPGRRGGMMSSASEDDPASLPLLISFDENSSGRAYQGMTELSVRPGTPVLNEAMALSLTAETGQPTQRYAYTVYSINGSATTTRLLLEHPDDGYANSLFDGDGYLYKADASSRFEYVDDDQSSYADQFKQINAVGTGNLQPIVNFLKWLDTASSEEFDAHLGDWVDVESFARYVATQNLLVNGDDMAGPGQNYYLWFDLDTKKITVVSWDLNLAMQGDTSAGPHDSVGMMGRGGDGPGAGMPPPEVPTPPQDGGLPGMTMGNPLKTRFLDSDAFTAVYGSAYWDLFEQMYGSGRAGELLDEIAATVPVSDGLTRETLQASVDSMRTWIDQRTDALVALRDQ